MLETLRVQNYALIDELEIEFGAGFNVLTGETGAGKSIIVGALDLVLGARATGESIRDGAPSARIDAVFRLPNRSRRLKRILEECGVELDDDALVLSRVLTQDGRSRAYAGGVSVPVSVLARIGDELVDLHGQHEHQSLLQPDRQMDLLDAFAGTEDDAAAVADTVARLREAARAMADLEQEDRERERRLEFLRFEVSEIEAAGLLPDEEDELKERRSLLTNAERIFELSGGAYAALYESEQGAAIDAVDLALRELGELAGVNQRFQSLAERLAEARARIDDIANELREFTTEVDFDPAELDTINARLALIGDLKRKYGETIGDVLEYMRRAAAQISAFEQRDQTLARLKGERDRLAAEAERLALALSDKRRAAARRLDKKISASLQELGMKGGRFETRIERAELTSNGVDRVEFLLAANPGEKLKPLRQVASGGEVSRVMLALKSVFAGADKIPTLIFDEIDAGVGGAIAAKVGARLRQLAESHQTICISHLPQIAAVAGHHFHVAKSTGRGRTTTSVAPITGDARVEELARLLDGSVSDVSLEHARALLKT